MRPAVVLLLVGLVVGAILGWVTAPKAVDVNVGPLSVTVDNQGGGGSVTAKSEDGKINVQVGSQSPLDDRNMRTLIFAVVGGLVGFGIGFAVDRRKS
jgi:hypothetical protein